MKETIVKTQRKRLVKVCALAALTLLIAGCSLLPYKMEINSAALSDAKNAASEISNDSIKVYLKHFESPRCMYLSAAGVEACRSYILSELKADGYDDSAVAIDPVTIHGMTIADADTPTGGFAIAGDFSMPNIIVTKAGSDPSLRPVLIGAHYDTVAKGPGVDDNGSGCAGVLEIARVLAHRSFPRTIVMAFFAFEEPGQFGSAHYVAGLSKSGLPMVAYILDSIGVTSAKEESLPLLSLPETGDFIAAMSSSSEDSREAVDDFLAINKAMGLGLPATGINADANASSSLLTSNLLRSDHLAFCVRGIPAILLTDTCSYRAGVSYYHLSTDTAANIDFTFLRKVIAATIAGVVVKASS